jgi:predicted transcriptional regulator
MGAVMRLRLSREAETGLAALAARLGSSVEAVASEAVERFVQDELATLDGIERALADMRAGRTVPHEQVMAEIDALLDGKEPPLA